MNKSIFILSFTLAICIAPVIKGMEELEFLSPMETNNLSPASQALIADYQDYITQTTDTILKKANARSVRTLSLLCILTVIKHNITQLSILRDELKELITSDAEYIIKNPTLYPHLPSKSPIKKRYIEESKLKHRMPNAQLGAKRRLFIKE